MLWYFSTGAALGTAAGGCDGVCGFCTHTGVQVQAAATFSADCWLEGTLHCKHVMAAATIAQLAANECGALCKLSKSQNCRVWCFVQSLNLPKLQAVYDVGRQ